MKAVVCASDGTILKTLEGNPALFGLQVGEDEFLLAIAEEACPLVDDSHIYVDDVGELALKSDAPGDIELPQVQLYFVPV